MKFDYNTSCTEAGIFVCIFMLVRVLPVLRIMSETK